MINPTFRNINRLFKHGGSDYARESFDNHYIPLVEIKYFHALINNKLVFDRPGNSKQETYKKLVEMSRNNDQYNRNLYYIWYIYYY